MNRDYTHVFFGLVVFAGVIAMLLMVAPDGQNRIGAATEIPSELDVEADVQEYVFSQGQSIELAGKIITLENLQQDSVTVRINEEERVITAGEVYALDSRRTFMFDQGVLYVFDQWDAQSCEGIYGQTKSTSPNNICCGVANSVPLPDCSQGNGEIQCGEKRIYCENGQLRSEVTQ